jgi:hypothetical protein
MYLLDCSLTCTAIALAHDRAYLRPLLYTLTPSPLLTSLHLPITPPPPDRLELEILRGSSNLACCTDPECAGFWPRSTGPRASAHVEVILGALETGQAHTATKRVDYRAKHRINWGSEPWPWYLSKPGTILSGLRYRWFEGLRPIIQRLDSSR